ncbi:MAG: alpha-D-ribose 1-methylphosphonate 5-triphosphate diphosphatase, partial [Actinomycetota bacterium]|nr:alpha-D-ribose 1-methylphosphonate 5-triphosphate diphosphatase [Actinomycetota bacterium]
TSRSGAGDLLCSDYHYPSLLWAPFAMEAAGLCSLGQAWEAVSARSARIDDRGRIEVGAAADLILLDVPEDRTTGSLRVVSTIVAGRVAHGTS